MSTTERPDGPRSATVDRSAASRDDDPLRGRPTSDWGGGSAPNDTGESTETAQTTVAESVVPVTVIGGEQVGRHLARRLLADRPIHYVDDDRVAVERAARRHDATYVSDLTDSDALTAAVDSRSHVVVATPRDATNLLVAQHCRSMVDVLRVIVVVTDPRTHDVYPADVERICATTVLADAVVATLTDAS